MTADIVFGRNSVHNNAFWFVKLYIFTRFGLAFTPKRSNGGLGSEKKVFRKQRFIVLMRTGKKEDSQKCWLQSLWHLDRRNRRTLCMQASLRASSPGGVGMREGKGEDLIGQILTTQHQRSHKGVLGVEFKFMRRQCKLSFPFFLPILHPHSPGRACSQAICRSKNALRGKYRHRTLDAFC